MNGLIHDFVYHTAVTDIGGCCGHGWWDRGNHLIRRRDCVHIHYWMDTQEDLDQTKKVG